MADDKKKAAEGTVPETGAAKSDNPLPTSGNPDPASPPAAPAEAPETPVIPATPAVPATPASADKDGEKKKTNRLERFLKKTGFAREDVDVVHEEAGVFGTVQGGKYKLAKTGEIITLKGPVPPEPEEAEG